MASLGDFYQAGGMGVAPPSPTGPSINASGSASQSVSGSVAVQGAPAIWFIALAALALFIMHAE